MIEASSCSWASAKLAAGAATGCGSTDLGSTATGTGFGLAAGAATGSSIERRTATGAVSLRATASIPVATTETRIMPVMSGSRVEPTMMLASGSTSERIRFAASSSSKSVRSGPAVMLIRTPFAPLRLISSSSGLAIAFSAACTDRPVLSGRLACSHHRLAHLVHHGTDIGEVEVDDSGPDHEVGHALDALVEDVVGKGKGFGEGRLLVGETEQVLVRDDDQCIDMLLQGIDTGFSLPHAAGALELERLGDDADRQHPHFARCPRDDRRRAGAGAATHPGGNEAHVATGKALDDLFDRLLGGGGTHLRTGPGTEALGDPRAQLQLVRRPRLLKRLRVGVRDDELAAFESLLDHVVDRIASRSSDTDDGDPRAQVVRDGYAQVQSHVLPPVLSCPCISP